jgi:hypothetical protein
MKLVVETRLDNNATDENPRLAIEQLVDSEIATFEEFFQNELKNDPLTRGEKAIIKTFLHYHLVYKVEAGEKA